MGSLSDRYSRDATAAVTMALGLVGYGLLVVADGIRFTTAAVVCVGVAMTCGTPPQSRFVDALTESERGAGFGLVRTVYLILGAASSVLVGAASDLAGWTIAFGLLSAITWTGLGVILLDRLLGFGY